MFSRESLTKAETVLHMKSHEIEFLGEKIPMILSQTGHYLLPITSKRALTLNPSSKNLKIHLVSEVKPKQDIALKLHRQFAHCTADRLIRLLKSAGSPWNSDTELFDHIQNLNKSCQTCLQYRQPKPRPVVGLPTATRFGEKIAMDLKFYDSKIILHMIDHATRFSMAASVPNKKPDTIVKAMFNKWIGIFGAPEKFLTDNGGEFVNKELVELAESFGMIIQTTAAEAPWSNGLVERHNKVIAQMLNKILADTKCNFEIALQWAISAKNSLSNVHGFSPYQLVLGNSPKLPSVLSDKPPAFISDQKISQILENNLKALHTAREAFIQAESSAKIRRALNSNTRTYSDEVYTSGDLVYYKRQQEDKWRGPAKVLGQDGQFVLLKHGGYYVRVHPCRMMHYNPLLTTSNSKTKIVNETKSPKNSEEILPSKNADRPRQNPVFDTDTDDEENLINFEEEAIHPDESHNLKLNETELLPQASGEEEDVHQLEADPHTTFNSTTSRTDDEQQNEVNDDQSQNLKANDIIMVNWHDNTSSVLKLKSRAGKVGKTKLNKYKESWNVLTPDGRSRSIDLAKQIKSWTYVCNDSYQETADEFVSNIYFQAELNQEIEAAKSKELNNWKDQNVYSEVDDQGQKCVSVRWVIEPKEDTGKAYTKARLVARGFEEDQHFRTDAPTCGRESLRLTLLIIAGKKWDLKSIDIKSAFLQGHQLERDVYLRPPVDAQTVKIWKLNKCVYGLADAPREFYLRLTSELDKLGSTSSSLDKALFTWQSEGELYGIMLIHVDDLLFGGTSKFRKDVIDPLCAIFKIRSEQTQCFTYIGLQLTQHEDKSISVTQNSFAQSIKKIPVDSSSEVRDLVNEDERTHLRSAIGQLNWLAGISRPDLSFDVCQLSTQVTQATIRDLVQANKVIKRAKEDHGKILYPSLNLNKVRIIAFADASFDNLPHGGSQGGSVIFLSDSKLAAPLQWSSNKIKRVVRSTIAAEALALSNACDSSTYLTSLVAEQLLSKSNLPVECVTDNRSLFDNIHSCKPVTEQGLRLDIAAIREKKDKNEISVTWTHSKANLANVLTKRGAPVNLLIDSLNKGRLSKY